MCHTFITRGVHGRFYGLYLKKENGCHGKHAMDTLDSSMMKKTAAVSNSKGKKLYPSMTCVVNSCQGKLLECYSECYSD